MYMHVYVFFIQPPVMYAEVILTKEQFDTLPPIIDDEPVKYSEVLPQPTQPQHPNPPSEPSSNSLPLYAPTAPCGDLPQQANDAENERHLLGRHFLTHA